MKKDKLNIVYEDKDLIVINKPSHLLTISTENEKQNTLFHKVMMYLKKKNKNNKVFIVHRLDKDTSGLVVFAKSESMKKKLQTEWENAIRGYVAVCHGVVEKNKDVIKSYLMETKTLLVYSTNNAKEGKLAITNYQKIMNNDRYTLLSLNIKTGRKNQIRVHLNDIGHSIVGDKKYSNIKTDPLRRMCLHANYLEFMNPLTNQKMIFDIDIPNSFIELCQ